METTMSLAEKLMNVQSKVTAPKTQFNKFGNYFYRSCEDILEAVKPALKEFGLSLVICDEIFLIGTRYYVRSIATVSDGKDSIFSIAYARESETRKGMDDCQITGSASSYARKYTLNGLFCIDDTKDADTINTHDKVEPSHVSDDSRGIVEANHKTPFERIKEKIDVKPSESFECTCGAVISKKVHDFSMDKYKEPLCFKCQGAKK